MISLLGISCGASIVRYLGCSPSVCSQQTPLKRQLLPSALSLPQLVEPTSHRFWWHHLSFLTLWPPLLIWKLPGVVLYRHFQGCFCAKFCPWFSTEDDLSQPPFPLVPHTSPPAPLPWGHWVASGVVFWLSHVAEDEVR